MGNSCEDARASYDTVVHIPVLHSDGVAPDSPQASHTVLGILRPSAGETVLDCTLGLAGHAESFLRATGSSGHLIGIDADAENVRRAEERLGAQNPRVTLIHGNFRDVSTLVPEPVDVLFADLGVSSPHFDDPSRGFTFRADAPLDLRFDRSTGKTAAAMLEDADAEELGNVFAEYGEFRGAFKLAAALVERGRTRPLQTTTELRECAEAVFGYRAPTLLPQIFQALRIWVNDELSALQKLLEAIPLLLRPGGRAGIISYHSLEDRLTKQEFRRLATAERDDRTGQDVRPAPFTLLTRKPVSPDPSEIARNPRARSARLRAIRRLPS